MAIKKCIVGADDVVQNVISLPDDWEAGNPDFWQPPSGIRLVDPGTRGQIGAKLRQDGGFDDPAPPVPPEAADIARIAALEETIQLLVDKAVVDKADLPGAIKGRIKDKPAP